MVALRVVHQTLGRNRLQLFFQFVQIFGASHLALVGQAEDEIAESEVIGENAAQVFQQRGRALAQERVAFSVGAWAKFCATGLQNHGNVRHEALDHARQFEAGLGAELAFPGEFHIGHHCEEIVAVALD